MSILGFDDIVLTLHTVSIQNSGPVSVDYSSLDEAVPNSFFSLLCLLEPAADHICQVTLEINTNPQKDSAGDGSSNSQNARTSKDGWKGQDHGAGARADTTFDAHTNLPQ